MYVCMYVCMYVMQWKILFESYSEYQAGLPTALRIAKRLVCSNKVLSLLEVSMSYRIGFISTLYCHDS